LGTGPGSSELRNPCSVTNAYILPHTLSRYKRIVIARQLPRNNRKASIFYIACAFLRHSLNRTSSSGETEMSYDFQHRSQPERLSMAEQLAKQLPQEEEVELSFLVGCPEPKHKPETD
jgi:hypothetical protein